MEHHLKTLDLSKTEFIANGNRYLIESKLSTERFFKMVELELHIGFGATYDKVYGILGEVLELANQSKFADIVILAHNTMNAIGKMEARQKPIQEFCAMFINREDEDRRTISQDLIDAKIADWEEEGFDFHGFFLLAINMQPALKESFLAHSAPTSQR